MATTASTDVAPQAAIVLQGWRALADASAPVESNVESFMSSLLFGVVIDHSFGAEKREAYSASSHPAASRATHESRGSAPSA